MRRWIQRRIALCLILWPVCAPAWGGDVEILSQMSLEDLMKVEVVRTASRHDEKSTEAPALVTVFTARDIRAFGWRNLSDVVQAAPGFYMTEDRNYNYIGVRGYSPTGDYNSRVLVLVDGRRMNENIYDSVGYGWDFPVDIENVERIEILRGPASVLYGSNALLGVVQVITRDAGETTTRLRVKADGMSRGLGRLFGSGETSGKAGGLRITASRMSSRGYVDLAYPEYNDPSTNGGVAHHLDGEDGFRASLQWRRGPWRFDGGGNRRNRDVSTGEYGTLFNFPGTRTRDERAYGSLVRSDKFGKWGLENRVSLDMYRYLGSYVYQADPPIVNQDDTHGVWATLEQQWNVPLRKRHHLVVGWEYRKNIRQDQLNYEDSYQNLDDRHSSQFWAFYAQDEWRFSDRCRLVAGLRHDRYAGLIQSTSPRFAFIWNPGVASAIRVSYGKAFRAPNVYERYYQDQGATQKPPLTLEPETVHTLETSLEGKLGSRLRMVLLGYRYRMEDLILLGVDPSDGLLVYSNREKAESWGGGGSLGWSGPGRRSLNVGYSYTWTKMGKLGTVIPNSPRHLLKARGVVTFWGERLLGGLETRFVGNRLSVLGNPVGSYMVTDLSVSWMDWPWKGCEIQAGAFNVFDRRYLDPVSDAHLQETIAQDGRTFRLSLSAEI